MPTPYSQSLKPFSSLETYEKNLQHLIWMAKKPESKSHAWYRAKELDEDPTGIFKGIAEALVKEMK